MAPRLPVALYKNIPYRTGAFNLGKRRDAALGPTVIRKNIVRTTEGLLRGHANQSLDLFGAGTVRKVSRFLTGRRDAHYHEALKRDGGRLAAILALRRIREPETFGEGPTGDDGGMAKSDHLALACWANRFADSHAINCCRSRSPGADDQVMGLLGWRSGLEFEKPGG